MKKKYLLFYIITAALMLSSCAERLVPSATKDATLKAFNVSEFDYYYVEAIKQKVLGNFGDALKYFEQCARINPASDAVYYQMGQILASNGNIHSAKKYVLKAVTLDEKNMWYLVSLSGMYYEEKNLDSAIMYYEKAVKYFPSNENIQLTLGNLYIENNKFDKANEIFESFDRKYGVNESSTLLSVKSLISSGKYDEAQAKIEALLKLKPDEILYNGLLAEILRAKGEKEKALDVYDKMIESDPGNGQVQLSIIDFMINEKKFDEIFEILNTVTINGNIKKEDKISLFARLIETPEIAKDENNRLTLALMVLEASYPEDDIVPLLRADLMFKKGALNDAATRLEEIVSRKPENYFAWEKLLLVYLEKKDYDNLFSKGQVCATRFNMSFIAKVLYASGATEKGKFDIALEELKKADILAGDSKESKIQVLTMRADVYYRMKDYTRAFQTFEEAMKFESNDMTLLNNYAYYLAEQNLKLKEAEELAKKVIETEKNNTTFLDTYAWVLYKRGKVRDAAKIMEAVIGSGEKEDAEWFEHYGYILKKQNKYEKARESWEKALELDNSKTELIKEIENCKK